MKMLSKRLASGLISLSAALVTILAMSSPASALTTYTPGGGPGINFVSSNASFKVIQANQSISCSQFDLAGNLVNSGTSRAVGANAANIGSLTSSGCTNPIMGLMTITPSGTWGLTVTGDPAATTWPVRMTNVSWTVVMVGCTFQASGVVNGNLNVATQTFSPTAGASGLKISSTPAGFLCPILGWANGQDIAVSGTWTNTPPAGSGPLTLVAP
ncbi:hypothetical protein [Aeromicrobium alkaliterrae]|uniref:Secreted protein n=1 Tax=Aeromicrobium alkaliterrae TaxID=302168 RepID=A0ABN2JY78_9ACTN